MTGFDSYPPVTRNTQLPTILADISNSSPPTPPLSLWSLDALFILPYARLRYYKKLYARLLRSTKEGRSDHRLVVVANQRLETLVSDVETRLEVDVGEDEIPDGNAPSSGNGSREQSWQVNERESRASSGRNSSLDSHTTSVLHPHPPACMSLTEAGSRHLVAALEIRGTRMVQQQPVSTSLHNGDQQSLCLRSQPPRHPCRSLSLLRCRTWNSG